jgi:uncharacterized membrane protein YccC
MSQSENRLAGLEDLKARLADPLAVAERQRAELVEGLLAEFGAAEIGERVFSQLSSYRDAVINARQELAQLVEHVDAEMEDIRQAVEAAPLEPQLQQLSDSVAQATPALRQLANAAQTVATTYENLNAFIDELRRSLTSDTSSADGSADAEVVGGAPPDEDPPSMRGGLTSIPPEGDPKS